MSLVRAERDAIEAVLRQLEDYELAFGSEKGGVWSEAPAGEWNYSLADNGQRIYLLGVSEPRNIGGMRDRVAVFGLSPSDGKGGLYEPTAFDFQTVKRAVLVAKPATVPKLSYLSEGSTAAVSLTRVSIKPREIQFEIDHVGEAIFNRACA